MYAYILACSVFCLALLPAALCDTWQPPTALTIQATLERCGALTDEHGSGDLQDWDLLEQTDEPDVRALIRCVVLDLGLWSDEEGYEAKRIAKLFSKHKMDKELAVVILYCMARHQNLEDPNRWAFDAYRCAAAGRVGQWVREYLKGLYAEKGSY